ncbi:MAG: NUDIX domain-containing protein [Bacteroidia bacterium]|nr:NUDIX domain-containing protein [Bacteroidia bacterium]
MYKIFFNDRVICLTDKLSVDNNREQSIIYRHKDKKKLFETIKDFTEKKAVDKIYIYSDDLKKLKRHFKSCFHIIKAAGGLVRNENGRILGIKRFGKWDFPKGKVEQNENYKAAAVREVSEECRLEQEKLVILDTLNPTYHTYHEKGIFILKKTYWFEMLYNGKRQPKPQTIEGITDIKWFDKPELNTFLQNTYFSLIDIVNEVGSRE